MSDKPGQHLTSGDRDAARVFGQNAGSYHRLRPRYPPALFDQIESVLDADHRRALELGAGTGIATRSMLDRGFAVTAIEPDPGLISVLRQELAGYADLTVIPVRFEDWSAPAEPFDLVYSATAFHWLDPAQRVRASAAALRPGGYLAVFGYTHVAGGDRAFFEEIQHRCYPRFMPGARADEVLLEPDELPAGTAELLDGGWFEEPEVWRRVIEERYPRAEYLALLETYSGHRWLATEQRDGLLRCIGDRIDSLPNQVVHKAYLHELILARRTTRSV